MAVAGMLVIVAMMMIMFVVIVPVMGMRNCLVLVRAPWRVVVPGLVEAACFQ